MLEIYNETIRDLLGKGKDEKLEIKIQGKGETDVYVPNLTIVDVNTESKVCHSSVSLVHFLSLKLLLQ